MTKNIFKIYILCLLTSCATSTNVVQVKSGNDEVYFPSVACASTTERNPSALQCVKLFSDQIQKDEDTSYMQKLQNDPLAVVEAKMNTSGEQDQYPVNTSSQIRKFRDRYLGFFKNAVVREPLTRSFEASMRMQSQIAENGLQSKGNYGQYDLVIVGTGVHGVIALHQALAKNPNLKILLVDEGDTAGATFRYGKEVFNINSSNRRSGEDTKPLPGEGNINELPGMPIQVSDLTNVKYPSANDLGTAIVAGLYSALREYPNVEILFNSRATQLLEKPRDGKMSESLNVVSDGNARPYQIDAQRIILTTGLGKPKIPIKVARTIEDKPALIKSADGKAPPRVITFEDMIRLLATSNDPSKIYDGKKIAVVGTGDSANVFIEYLLGYAAREGYARSSAQNGRADKIYWIGQSKKTCKDFISDIRSRYQQVSTGFRSSSKNLEATITPFEGRLDNVSEKGDSQVTAILNDRETVPDVDYIVVTTGFDQNVRTLFQDLTRKNSLEYKDDVAFFDGEFNTLMASTSTSVIKTKVGRQFRGRQVYVLGTAAGSLVSDFELPSGIIQNTVSIFNNAPRVVAATKILVTDLKTIADASDLKPVKIDKATRSQVFTITDIQESRYMPSQTMAYLESTFKEALSYSNNTSGEKIKLTLSLQKNGDLQVTSDSLANVKDLVTLLAQSREFFSLTRELLIFTPGQDLLFTALGGTTSAKAMTTPSATKPALAAPKIANRRIKFRGLEKKKDLETEKESGKEKVGKSGLDQFDLSDPEVYKTNNIFHPIKPDEFQFSRTGVISVGEPFEMMATPVTQATWVKLLLLRKEIGNPANVGFVPSANRSQTEVIIDNMPVYIKPNHPVESLSYDLAYATIQVINQISKMNKPALQNKLKEIFPGHRLGDKYDLPTEEQFEFVETNGGKSNKVFYSSNDGGDARKFSWTNGNATETQPVATRMPRLIQDQLFFDLEGNVAEMTKATIANPTTTIARGGSFRNNGANVYAASPAYPTSASVNDLGFRLIRTRAKP